MSKAVLISINPKWVELILNGKKTIEVRKAAPKLETPFKVYVYCAKSDKNYKDIWTTAYMAPSGNLKNMSGKVVAEFICDTMIDFYSNIAFEANGKPAFYMPSGSLKKATCLTNEEMVKYGKGKVLHGLHISDLKVYDEPKELIEFGLYEKKDCDHYYRGICGITERLPKCCDYACNRKKHIYPPQSWCYVEEI